MEALLNYSDSDGGTGADDRGSEEGTSDCSSTSEAPSILDELDSNQPPTPPGNREAESKHRLLSAADLFAVQIDTVHVKPQKKEFEITPTELESNGKPGPSSYYVYEQP